MFGFGCGQQQVLVALQGGATELSDVGMDRSEWAHRFRCSRW